MARRFQPQVLLCDVGLPALSGYEVARRLRAQPEFSHTRRIAISGYGQEEDRRRSRDAGFDYHLTKPVEPNVLTALLAALSSGDKRRGATSLITVQFRCPTFVTAKIARL